ncbi:MAG: 50S ribosomal protein L11 methyltransferase [Dehalococcoidia bacterium]|nr:50S ribosomal protein L11 methyltransferase [Dehalococcoidia bacterium]MYD29183.1 50S ribosomal protein L11 methyltransferase [Dehalococcoidia bacterium]
MTGLWYEITAATPPALVEAVSAVMRETAPGGLSLEEPVDLLGPEEGYAVRGGEPVALRVYLPASELGAVLTQRLREELAEFPEVELTARPLYEQDWAVSWREFFGPVEAGRISIVPSWVEYEAAPGQLIVRLDPGQAFGTGHHETTRLCLAALDETVQPGAHVLDIGAGSGILSIAAVKLGASRVDAFEIDPIAADVARANCEANDAGNHVTIRGGFPSEGVPPADLAVANVSARADIELAEALAGALKPTGRLIASGFLTTDRDDVLDAFAEHGLTLTGEREERDWALLELARD